MPKGPFGIILGEHSPWVWPLLAWTSILPDHHENHLIWVESSLMVPWAGFETLGLRSQNMPRECPVGPRLISATLLIFSLIIVTVQLIMCTFYCLYCISYIMYLSSLAYIKFIWEFVYSDLHPLNCLVVAYVRLSLLLSIIQKWKCIPGISINTQHQHSESIKIINHKICAWFQLSIGLSKAYCHHSCDIWNLFLRPGLKWARLLTSSNCHQSFVKKLSV